MCASVVVLIDGTRYRCIHWKRVKENLGKPQPVRADGCCDCFTWEES
ncbi:MAG: hypothetical protein K9K66_04365 [Desulfarculaceae bacterium]|nr:hypothetical protein [Desulfarculaceae bacterium]MCF8073277.1 hypothetical protein [Desulfarculaceae bacterium]MCF8100873.1 hypothetical protein [Desulfarculaceae bacterium]MCF8116671.1 hypothetical protein [Desulfarculaceae bacterium]